MPFCLCVHCPSICLSSYLLLNHWAELNQTCYITSPHGKGVQEEHYFSVYRSGIPPCVHHTISSYTTGQNSTKLATSLPLMVKVCDSNIIFPRIHHPSICLSQTPSETRQVSGKYFSYFCTEMYIVSIVNKTPSETISIFLICPENHILWVLITPDKKDLAILYIIFLVSA